MELFYATGGHGGPYKSQVDARNAAIRMLTAELPLYPHGHNIQIRPDSTSEQILQWVNVEDVEQLGRSYRDALTVQSACNLSGVVYSFERAIKAMCALGFDTVERNEHPISVLFATQIAHLTKCEDFEKYHAASAACQKHDRKSSKPEESNA